MIDMTREEIVRLLADAHIGRLCMADGEGRPYAVPFPFCWLDGAVYLRLPLTGRKGQVLAANNRVCFEVDHYTSALDDYASVLVEGRLMPVGDIAEKRRVKEAVDEKYRRLRNGHRPGHGRSTALEALPVQRIQVEQISGRRKDTPA